MSASHNSALIARFMGPIWGRQGPVGPHVGPMNFAIWVCLPQYQRREIVPHTCTLKEYNLSVYGDSLYKYKTVVFTVFIMGIPTFTG